MPSAAKCRSCGASIKWALTEKGKRMPLDCEPVEGGNIATYVPPDPGTMRHVSHSTCPQASGHRSKEAA